METETGEADAPQNFDVSEAATDALRDALGTPSGESDQEAASPETEEAALPEGQEQAPGGQPEPIPEPMGEEVAESEQPTEEERLAKRRIRPRNELDQQVIDLYRSEGFAGTFAEASDVIYGRHAPQEQRMSEAPEPVDPYAAYDSRADGLSTEISELETKIAEAAENLETTEAMNLQRELFRKELELSETKTEKGRRIEDAQKSVAESQRRKALESRERALQAYPDLGSADTVYRKEFDSYISRAEQDPDYAAVFTSPRWPEILANEFAAVKGYRQAPTGTAPQPPPQQAPQMGNQAKVLTSGTTAQPANAPTTPEALIEGMPNMSNDQLYALLGQPDGKRVLR